MRRKAQSLGKKEDRNLYRSSAAKMIENLSVNLFRKTLGNLLERTIKVSEEMQIRNRNQELR